MNARHALIPVGPWAVVRPLPVAFRNGGGTHLSLHAGLAQWVGQGEFWKRWLGTEAEARRLAAEFECEAVPTRWVRPSHNAARFISPAPVPARHAHDRFGEEIES